MEEDGPEQQRGRHGGLAAGGPSTPTDGWRDGCSQPPVPSHGPPVGLLRALLRAEPLRAGG